jgi:hypothetical protein
VAAGRDECFRQTLNGQNDASLTVSDSGSLMLELFETYDDIANATDAFWNGTLYVQFLDRVSTGFDYQDAESVWCDMEDCAVDYDHSITFQALEGRYYIGLFNAKNLDEGLFDPAHHQSQRFNTARSPMSFTLSVSIGNFTSSPCHANCSQHGTCGARAPVCDCEPGYFGEACQIEPRTIEAHRFDRMRPFAPSVAPPEWSRDRRRGSSPLSPQVSTTLLEGHFDYFELKLPAGVCVCGPTSIPPVRKGKLP